MRDLKNKFSNRLLAVLLSVAMIVTMIPVSMIADAATANHPDTVTITVVDENGQAIKDASVEVTVDSVINGDAYIKETKVTGEDGVVDVMESSAFVANDFTISAKITATGFADGTLAATKIESADANFEIALVSTTINDVTIEGKTLTYTGNEQELVSVTEVEGDTVTYVVDGGEATTETPVATDVCSHEIKVTVSRSGKEDFVKTVTAKIEPADITGISIAKKTQGYNEEEQSLVELTGSFEEGDVVTWTLNGTDTGSETIPKAMAIGEYVVTLTVNRGTNYNVFTQTVTSKIIEGELKLDGLKVTALDGVYDTTEQEVVEVQNKGNYNLQYQLDDGDQAVNESTWQDTIPTVKDAGEYIVWVKAVKEGYSDKDVEVIPAEGLVAPYNVKVEAAEQELVFVENIPSEVTLNANCENNQYNFRADGDNLSEKNIKYELVDATSTDVASIDENGVLTVKEAGIVTVKASRDASNNYAEIVIYNTLVVKNNESSLVSFDASIVEYIVNENFLVSDKEANRKYEEVDNGLFHYSIDKDEIGLSINEEGQVTIDDIEKLAAAMKKGSVKVEITVEKSAGTMKGYEWYFEENTWMRKEISKEVFSSDEATYSILIAYKEAPEFGEVCEITSPDIETGWYNKENSAEITVKDNLPYSIALDSPKSFESSLQIIEEGTKGHNIYFKEVKTGDITAPFFLDIKIDTTSPKAENVEIEFEGLNFLEQLMDGIRYGYASKNDKIKFNIADETEEEASGVDYIEWTYKEEGGKEIQGVSKATKSDMGSFVAFDTSLSSLGAFLEFPVRVAEQTYNLYRGRISFVVYDVAGNCSEDTGKVEKDTEDTVIITDTIAPVIEVIYDNENVVNELEDSNNNLRKYYNAKQKATIKITERNFDEELVNIQISATDVAGNDLTTDSEAKLYEMSEWSSDENGGEHTVTITYSGDANYTFDIACKDLAGNEGVVDLETEEKYKTDYFTVDQTVPTTVSVAYDESVLDTVLDNISFGFYKEKVKVTLTATDDTSGVHSFLYSYRKASGISAVNAELLNQAIEATEITYSDDNKTATVEFYIPKDVLKNDNQFNGNVEFTVTDRSGNVSELHKEEQRIVVDNIAPTAEVIYNSPVNVEGDISYYNGDIKTTVTVNEANFYASDVQVMVSKDGGAATEVTPTWTDTSVDVHVGTFTLSEDGDYIITITYTDKSSNAMATYTSKQMTIDTEIKKATYSINGIAKNEVGGAYKNDAVIAFNFEDENFDTNTIKLERTRFDSVEDVTDEFIKVTKNEKGGSGKFTIPVEVENDGIYVLTIGMTDKAKHSTQSQLKFTINRYGSVYEYDKYLSSLIKGGGQYITISEGNKEAITEDLVITEYNADRLLAGSLKILITRDGQTIKAEYTTDPAEMNGQVAVGDSGWYQYEYTISKKNFKQDGVYKITLTSAYATSDSASNESTSVPENSIDDKGNQIVDTMGFVVDTEAPEIRNVVNLEKAIVDKDKIVDGKLTVKYTIVDVGGLKSIEIIVNGETIDTITEFGENVFNYSGEFVINESNDAKAQTVQIRVTDFAGNVTDTAAEDFSTGDLYVFNGEVTVSTNFFVRWYANKPLFWGSIAGVIIIAGAICFIIVAKRKKEE